MDDLFDAEKPAHTTSLARLETQLIAWLITTTADGRPHPAPVWFLWHDGIMSMLTEPDALKARHLRRGSPAVVHLESGGPFGDDITVLRGDVRLTPDGGEDWVERFREPYVAKYADAIEAYGMPVEQIGKTFSTVIAFTPTRLIAWGA